MTETLQKPLESLSSIESLSQIIDTMNQIEKNYHNAVKKIDSLNTKQDDLLHALELDLDDDEVKKVTKAIRDLRKERREMKDELIQLIIARDFVLGNRKFMAEASETIKRIKRAKEKVEHRKYYVRDCDAVSNIISIEKHSDKIVEFIENT
ncbi:hypothetical protein ACIQ1D_19010 [Lysinibacillus xylanilyticus]|uniref:hypothetical protein n=1 Tax=Lysinibacillus xylanilyticus TaxID=582475 RepID=UPI0037FAC1CE